MKREKIPEISLMTIKGGGYYDLAMYMAIGSVIAILAIIAKMIIFSDNGYGNKNDFTFNWS